ncbi:MAG: glucose-6-phosphate dehydrogenase [archaeon]|nr:glucose-6-phosphate dehydrogenase [archaeon]
MQNDFTFIIMGATGDLAQKKLFPAIHRLISKNKLGNDFSIVAVARSEFSNEQFSELVKKKISGNEAAWKTLEERLYYQKLDFDTMEGYENLGKFLKKLDKKRNIKSNKLFYLATLPKHFKGIAKNLKKFGLAEETKKNWCRVVFEKPFGNDEISAGKLNKEIRKVFAENQIYRIDHYLGKELVQNIGVLRGANRIFSPLWNAENIDHVQINLLENFGVENRSNFYDQEGAMKDVGQNHLIQLLCLTAMEIPKQFNAKSIRDEKVKVLKSIRKIIGKNVVLGQYEGYTEEKGVKRNSNTETFFAMKLFIDNKRWKGVPFYLRSGKNLGKKFASIYIQFKEPNLSMFKGQEILSNYLVIQIQPEDGMLVRLNGKAPGEKLKVMSVKMTFCHQCAFGPNSPEAYETLIHEALDGDQSVFIRADEIEESWKIIDQAIALKKKPIIYSKNSFGPTESEKMMKEKDREWFNKSENVVQGI